MLQHLNYKLERYIGKTKKNCKHTVYMNLTSIEYYNTALNLIKLNLFLIYLRIKLNIKCNIYDHSLKSMKIIYLNAQ